MKLLRAPHIALLTVAIAACGSDGAQSLDPTATYDVYGERFEPGVAVPAPAVVAESEVYIGRTVIVEGVAVDDCPEAACLTTIAPSGGGRINVFRPSDEGDVYDVPGDITGRRIVVSGRLEEVADSTFRLHATGIMVEKVRN